MTEHNNVTISRELLRQALGALEQQNVIGFSWTITALRNALEQPVVEPVAWIRPSGKAMLDAGGYCTVYASDGMSNHSVPLFAAPQTQQLAPQECKHCTKFFSQYRCNASQGECDCPKCQGFCTCSQQPRKAVKLTDEEIEELVAANAGYGNNFNRVARAIEQAVLKANGVEE